MNRSRLVEGLIKEFLGEPSLEDQTLVEQNSRLKERIRQLESRPAIEVQVENLEKYIAILEDKIKILESVIRCTIGMKRGSL